MSDLFHVDQATADRWRADGRFVLFGEGERVWCFGSPTFEKRAPAWMVEAAKPCETCGGSGVYGPTDEVGRTARCRSCSEGQRRHPVTVPCGFPLHGRISTGLLAVVEWGPLVVVRYGKHRLNGEYVVVLVEPDSRRAFRVVGHSFPVQTEELTLPPDIDPQSLVGQFAIGGRIEVAP